MADCRKTSGIIVFLLVVVILWRFCGFRSKQYKNTSQQSEKYILYWMPLWQKDVFSNGNSKIGPFQHCKFKNCIATHHRGQVPMERFDAIIFDGTKNDLYYKKPWKRTPRQRYIFATLETPLSGFSEAMKLYTSFYNWTMTYRLDSDIPMRYGNIIKNNTHYTTPDLDFVEHKTGLVAWIVSNCRTSNNRKKVFDKLHEVLSIDVYGECGNFTCPGESEKRSEFFEPCYDFVAQKYKFYLSFENAHCKDYVTEKLYMALERNIVPIVYGWVDYEYFAPPNSIIVVDKFQSVTELANYIIHVNNTPEEYLKYFEWKKEYYVSRFLGESACTLCKMLNNPLEPSKVYYNLYEWWTGLNHSFCKVIT